MISVNLALRKPATESSTYTYSIPVAASYAVDGNTDGKFLNGSEIIQGTREIHLSKTQRFNTNRLSNYQVSISNMCWIVWQVFQRLD
jgi:hypothetical protein